MRVNKRLAIHKENIGTKQSQFNILVKSGKKSRFAKEIKDQRVKPAHIYFNIGQVEISE